MLRQTDLARLKHAREKQLAGWGAVGAQLGRFQYKRMGW